MYTGYIDRGIPTVRYDHGDIDKRKPRRAPLIVIIIGLIASFALMGYYDSAVREMNQETRERYEARATLGL